MRLATFDRDWTIAPGATLADWAEENGLPSRVCESIAAALRHATGIPTRLWLNLEHAYRTDLRAGRKDTT